MIRLIPIVQEIIKKSGTKSERRFPMTSIQARKYFESDFSVAWERRGEIKMFRLADKGRADYELMSPTKQERTSKDADNIYTVLMGALPSWRGLPRRSFSLIGWTGQMDEEKEEHYGDFHYQVYPKNGAKIVIANESDLLDNGGMPNLEKSFNVGDVQDWGIRMRRLISYANPKLISSIDTRYMDVYSDSRATMNMKYDQYGAFIKWLNDHINPNTYKAISDAFIKRNPVRPDEKPLEASFGGYDILSDLLRIIRGLKKFGDWEKYLDFLFNPKLNKFEITTIEEMKPYADGREFWVEEDCIMRRAPEEDPSPSYDDEEEEDTGMEPEPDV